MKFRSKSPAFRRQRGFLNLGCIGILIAIGCLWGGGQALYTAVKNRKPVEMEVQAYIKAPPNAEWVTLTKGVMSLAESAYLTTKTGGLVTEVFIPVRPDGEAEGEKVHILLSTKDEKIKTAIKAMNDAGSNPRAIADVMKNYSSLMVVKRPVSGLVKFGIDSSTKTREKLEALQLNLAPNYVIIADGDAPSFTFGFGLLGVGLVVGFFLLRRAAK